MGSEEFSRTEQGGIGQRTSRGGGKRFRVEAGSILDERGVVSVAPRAGGGGGERQAGRVDEVDGIDVVVGERKGWCWGGGEIGDIVEMEIKSGRAQGVGFRTAVVSGNPDRAAWGQPQDFAGRDDGESGPPDRDERVGLG